MDDEVRELLEQATGFEWDAGNQGKVVSRHRVEPGECEQAFLSEPFLVSYDEMHSKTEPRWRAMGRTSGDRCLFLVFTIRKTLVRVVAARDMNRKERAHYGEIKERFAKDSDV
jgi:uncharacterized DUF497 family protein